MSAPEGIHSHVKLPSLLIALNLLMQLHGSAQDLVDSEVVAENVPETAIASAVQAVAELGKSVVQGRYQVALERMNPKEKKRLAMQQGGLEAVEEKLKAVPAEMVKQGVRILSCKPQGKPLAYGVEPKMVVEEIGGKKVSRMKNSQWLIMVPTVTRFEVLHREDGQPAKWIEIESLGFQVAVSERDEADWTFIDGAGLTVGHLRTLYLTMPADIELPKLQKRQVQN